MHHQPTQLALLISLIGIGVTPNAHASANLSARLDERAIDAIQRLPGVPCDELATATLLPSGLSADPVWQVPRPAPDLPAAADMRVLYTTAPDDSAPGEMPGEVAPLDHWAPREIVEQVAANPAEADEQPREAARQSAGEIRTVRMFAPAQPLAQAQPFARADAAFEQIEQIERLEAMPPVDEANATQDGPLPEILVAVLHGTPLIGVPIEMPVALPVEIGTPKTVTRIHHAEPTRIEPAPAPTETQTSRVLRNLSAILSDERDEVGAIRPDPSTDVVTTQADKVMAMLGEIAAGQPPVEDGPARRLRKLAARAAKAEAKADAEAAAVADEVARVGVDLMLPLELPTVAAVLPVDGSATFPSIELAALPIDAQFAAATAAAAPAAAAPVPAAAPAAPPARANPFGGRQVAVADSSLDRVRGGFGIDGLSISFGIERAVYINGALVTTTSLNVSDLGRITAGRGTTAFDVGTIGLIQSGAGNVVSPTMISAGSLGTVIQNTLDGQKIQNVTIINATTNSLGLLKGINMQSSLRGAVIDSLRR